MIKSTLNVAIQCLNLKHYSLACSHLPGLFCMIKRISTMTSLYININFIFRLSLLPIPEIVCNILILYQTITRLHHKYRRYYTLQKQITHLPYSFHSKLWKQLIE